jgi:hypothetical protein
MKWKFGASFTDGYAKTIRCGHRISTSRVRCSPVNWVIGDSYYHGWVTPFYWRAHNGTVYWDARWKMNRTDEYCIYALHRSRRHCTKVFRR